MADDHQRQIRVQCLKMLNYAVNVVDHGIKILNQYAFALRQPMAKVVGAEYPCALRL
ncbi:hypothetical protein D3C75_1133950 [compost metagenome]